jgi:Flp pilus assembly protein TadG
MRPAEPRGAVGAALQAWRQDRRGVSAIEFAFGAPFLVALTLVGTDTTRYAMAVRRIESVASTIGQMVAVSATGQIAPADLQFYEDSTMVIFPQVLQDSAQQRLAWSNDISLTVSSIGFTNVSGSYVGKTQWSTGPRLRACLTPMQSVADTAAPSPTTLPRGVFGPGSLIVVDVSFAFRPTIATAFMRTLTIARSFYVQPRYVQAISYTGSASTTVNQC